ncbi:hypothetical protein SAMN04488021_15617 [Paracoccus aminovorans]|uniref:Uncharacterized protein n=1 Tax=Paracoccus aminovorans TaxID=34004 RepID=A0A1I3EXX9_9RHOB|nr:hypothetical protein JCM7685_2231 [Paracoccus aminovorans]SFI03776.1 hypothetical protein SAMN04488021_15617 [Paracoccus aminovorans]
MMFQLGLRKTARDCGDQRRRDAPALTGAAFRQAFNPLQRRQIRSPKPSLQNEVSHRRHRRSCGTSPTALWVAMSGTSPSAMASSAITCSPQLDGRVRTAASPVVKACLRFRRSGSTLRPALLGRSSSKAAQPGSNRMSQTRNRDVAGAPRRPRRPSSRAVPSDRPAFLQGKSRTTPCRSACPWHVLGRGRQGKRSESAQVPDEISGDEASQGRRLSRLRVPVHQGGKPAPFRSRTLPPGASRQSPEQ